MVSQEVLNCIDIGDCVVMTITRHYIQIGIFAFAGVLLVMLFFIAFWTPGFMFLRARMSKNPLIYIINRGQSGRFAVGKAKSEGILDVRKTGPFIITENSHTRETKSGIPLFFAFGEFAATLPLTWVYVINKLKRLFVKTQNQEIKHIVDLGDKVGMIFDEVNKTWKS